MGIQPSEALALTLYDYTGLLAINNANADPDGSQAPLDVIPDEVVAREFDRAERLGFLKMVH